VDETWYWECLGKRRGRRPRQAVVRPPARGMRGRRGHAAPGRSATRRPNGCAGPGRRGVCVLRALAQVVGDGALATANDHTDLWRRLSDLACEDRSQGSDLSRFWVCPASATAWLLAVYRIVFGHPRQDVPGGRCGGPMAQLEDELGLRNLAGCLDYGFGLERSGEQQLVQPWGPQRRLCRSGWRGTGTSPARWLSGR
jgi:hypothetical protein